MIETRMLLPIALLRGTVEPRSNGPASNGIPPITDANLWYLQQVFSNLLY